MSSLKLGQLRGCPKPTSHCGSTPRTSQPFPRRCSAVAPSKHHPSSQQASESQSPTFSSAPCSSALSSALSTPSGLLSTSALALLAPLLRTQAAWADEAEEVIIEQVDALQAESLSNVVAAAQQEQSLYDIFVTIAFSGVVLALTVVTLGVAYLSLTQWLDSRQEKKDQEEEKNPKKATSTSQTEAESKTEEVVSLKKAFSVKRDKTKGFGSNEKVVTTPKEF